MKNVWIFWTMLFFTFTGVSQKDKLSPGQFFPRYGKEYHFHSDIMRYVHHVSLNNPHMVVKNIGESYQGRPLHLIFISLASNLSRLEDIQQTQMYNAGLTSSRPEKIVEKALVWSSFGTHGNEAGTTGSVPQIVFELLQKLDDQPDIFDDIVIVIDPCVNPDGYDRYVHFIKSTSHQRWIPDPNHREHMEPWPSGRSNHYMFDLNRDWAWQTQKESRERVKAYNEWLPHVHADFHEMGYNANYYFAPAAQPYHEFLTDFQREFQIEVGKNHARYFDQRGWLYWTRELFDLMYPSYGDTYPSYNGAVGMTYEMAGNTASGRAIQLKNGDTLSVQDKIDRNTVVALSTVETAARSHQKLIDQMKKFYRDAQENPPGKFKSYIIRNHPSQQRLTDLLEKNQIRFTFAEGGEKLTGYRYSTRQIENVNVEEGDIIIRAAQPKSVLLQVLMEESPVLTDSMTYDITAWSLPMAFGADCYAFSSDIRVKSTDMPRKKNRSPEMMTGETAVYSFEIEWNDVSSTRVVAALHQKGFMMRTTVRESSFGGRSIPRGTVFIHKDDNRRVPDFEKAVYELLKSLDFQRFHVHTSGFSDAGGDLGGNYYEYLDPPKVLTFSGRHANQQATGEVWYYFDQIIEDNLHIVDWEMFDRVDLAAFNTMILPEGYYPVEASQLQKLEDWVTRGGRLIVIGYAVSALSGSENLRLQRFVTEEEQKKSESEYLARQLNNRTQPFGDTDRQQLSRLTSGAIISNEVDPTHPLGYGIGSRYHSLKTSSVTYPLQKGMWNVVRIPEETIVYGFVGHHLQNLLSNTVTVAMQQQGRGSVVYFLDNPLFRCFWDRGLFLFSNAVFQNSRVSPLY